MGEALLDRSFKVAGGPEAAHEARDDAADALDGWLAPALLEEVLLLVSELVTNACVHGGGRDGDPVAMQLTLAERLLRVTVVDEGDSFVPVHPPGEHVGSGLGLMIVDRLATRWGVVRDGRTSVWFEIALAPAQEGPPTAPI